DFGTFSSADRGEPRNQGYEYNWANVGNLTPNGVTTADLIPLGQVGGVSSQVVAGKVNVVFLTVGGNDFRSIFFGADPATVITQGLTNEITAVLTLQAADPNLKIIL